MRREFNHVRFAHSRACGCALLVLVLLLTGAGAEGYRELNVNDRGEDVLALKNRMLELGYYQTANFDDQYNEKTCLKAAQFLSRHGLPADTPSSQMQELLFSADALPVTAPVRAVAGNLTAPVGVPELPALDENGTLLDKTAEPFVYQDKDDGLWYYIGGTLYVQIKRYTDQVNHIVWFETRVRVSDGNTLKTFFSDDAASGGKFDYPLNIAKKNDAVLALSDDFFGWRKDLKKPQGAIIRNGRVYSDTVYDNEKDNFPALDTLALFSDGSAKAFAVGAHTAQEYLEMGAVNTLAFGPVLVSGGVVNEEAGAGKSDSLEPRNAIGVFAPGDYVFLTVLGRRKESDGSNIGWLARRMGDLGVQEALNLDGGNSVMLVFEGEMLNKAENVASSAIRQTTTLIGFTDGQ